MVGTRVPPDNNDIVVWKLDESTTPFINSSTSSNAISQANSNLTTISGNVQTQQPGLFGANSCVFFSGNNSGSPRNFISGAVNTQPQPPLTVSGWVFLRAYNTTGFTIHLINRQHTVNVWFGPFSSLQVGQNRQYVSQPQQWDFSVNTTTSAGGNAFVSEQYTIPLHTWSHIGLTYDGTTVNSYINGNNVGSGVASPTGNISYGNGPWFFGAIPSGSGNPEESCNSVCDVRIADVVRPVSYFQNIYRQGILNDATNFSVITKFYKMRAFDIYYTNTPVYWTGTTVSYENAPASPSGLGLGPIEIVQTWNALNT